MEQYLIIVGLLAVGLALCGTWYEVRKHRQVAQQLVMQQASMAMRTAAVPPAPGKSAALTSLDALHDKVDAITGQLDTMDAVNKLHDTMEQQHQAVDGALRNAAASMSELHEKVDAIGSAQAQHGTKLDVLGKATLAVATAAAPGLAGAGGTAAAPAGAAEPPKSA